jgi:hypothetical protein
MYFVPELEIVYCVPGTLYILSLEFFGLYTKKAYAF